MLQATHKDLMGAFEFMLHNMRKREPVKAPNLLDSDLAEYASELAGAVLRNGEVNAILKEFTK